MESVRSDPVCIPNREDVSSAVTFDLNRCSFEDNHENSWQDLERYWRGEKHRVHQLETRLSSSLEHLLYDDCLNKPWEGNYISKDENSCYTDSKYVRGEDIKDIPTSYVLNGFQPNEFIVIGTYVDKRIIPGFKYRVRQNITNKHFFGGKALFLEQIGLGYGKRITFAGNSLNKNENYFWSDNSPEGFGFSLEAIDIGNKFLIVDCTTKLILGYVVVTGIERQVEIHSNGKNDGNIEKEVKVAFVCDINAEESSGIKCDQVAISGTAIVVKGKRSRFAEVKYIKPDSFITEGCELWPVDVAISC